MQNRSHFAVRAIALAGGLALAVAATAAPSKAEQSVHYRQGIYTAIAWNFGPMAAAVQGKIPFDKDAFARQAARVATLTPMLAEGFAVESSNVANTEAKPGIWTDRAEFDRLMKDLVTRTATLADVAKSGDLAKIKPAFADAGQACKACHDKFKKE